MADTAKHAVTSYRPGREHAGEPGRKYAGELKRRKDRRIPYRQS